ncbi:hypothetical protein PCANC_05011 [Puccinia coronata f. sp. avenae]|uniref:Retrotransposon gag domain-containing protein n=1 Tax=Puccinia coronata f. sp. avenae TaxID=200324 RepID=A0A2N5T7N7_9BASI|nr:hypothetical protein PCANC_05011 [Puccinia coronata f. sp. avenae]PLW45829.1 hypothetical protein PCASD_04783 [Puccinia coronata f. sp. avenae]
MGVKTQSTLSQGLVVARDAENQRLADHMATSTGKTMGIKNQSMHSQGTVVKRDAEHPRLSDLQSQIDKLNLGLKQQTADLITLLQVRQVETIPARLPLFDGYKDPSIWLAKVEAILRGHQCPVDLWASAIVESMQGNAELWWYHLVTELGTTKKIPWDTFRWRLLDHFDSYIYSPEYARHELEVLKFTTLDEYIDTFRRLMCRLPKKLFGDSEAIFLVTQNLPARLWEYDCVGKCQDLNQLFRTLQRVEYIIQLASRPPNPGRAGARPVHPRRKNYGGGRSGGSHAAPSRLSSK